MEKSGQTFFGTRIERCWSTRSETGFGCGTWRSFLSLKFQKCTTRTDWRRLAPLLRVRDLHQPDRVPVESTFGMPMGSCSGNERFQMAQFVVWPLLGCLPVL